MMKQEINPAIMIGGIVGAIIIVGLIAWMALKPGGSEGTINANQLKATHTRKAKAEGD